MMPGLIYSLTAYDECHPASRMANATANGGANASLTRRRSPGRDAWKWRVLRTLQHTPWLPYCGSAEGSRSESEFICKRPQGKKGPRGQLGGGVAHPVNYKLPRPPLPNCDAGPFFCRGRAVYVRSRFTDAAPLFIRRGRADGRPENLTRF